MKVVPWSWTLYETYQTCPKLCYETRITKNFRDDPNNQTLLWANHVHKGLELRIGDGVPLPANMAHYEDYAATLSKAPGTILVEQEVGMTNPFEPGGPRQTGYWDSDCWHRGKDDFQALHHENALVVDHKTGKKKPGSLQLMLSAVRTFVCHPHIQKVTTGFAWLGGTPKPEYTTATYVRGQLQELVSHFRQTVADMEWSEKNNVWPAKPSGLCKRSKRPGSTYGGCIVATCPHSEYYKRG